MLKHFPSGSSLKFYEAVDSTSLEAKRLVQSGEAGPLWIMAGRQTDGYGRRGAAWFQAEGDVAASFIFMPGNERESLSQLSYVAALAVADVIGDFAPGVAVEVKWPNDVLIDNKKAAGILLELITGEAPLIVFGVGVNIVSAPTDLEYKAARLIDYGSGETPSPLIFLEALDGRFSHWREVWRQDGFASIRRHWLDRAARLGEVIEVRLTDRQRSGRFKGLSEEGALILATDEGDELITAGAVFFGETTR